MAVVLAFRVGIALAPGVIRAWQSVQGPAVANWEATFNWMRDRLLDPNESDEDLSRDASAHLGYPVQIATYTGDFEVRRVQVEWSFSDPGILDEDVRVCTFHVAKLSGGLPDSNWLQADFDAVSAELQQWWAVLKDWYSDSLVLSGIKFYKAGPNVVPPQPPVFDQALNVAGLAANQTPPQLALSVTEMAGQKKNWGRFYLPAPGVTNSGNTVPTTNTFGRPSTEFMTAVIDATDAMYQDAAAVSKVFGVYRPHLEANRPTGNPPAPSTLPERPANFQTVDKLQIDDVWDIIRSRRYEQVTLRLQRDIGSGAAAAAGAATPADEHVGD